MAKYNITEKREKEAAYRTLVNPKLMDELKDRIKLLNNSLKNLEKGAKR